jgi:hypothetical protein
MNCESAPIQPSIESDHVRLPTQHGLMVAWGQFAQDIGLIEGLMHVPVLQKMVRHAPQKKLLEFQMVILAGVEYLQDINAGPHPLARDRTVAQAWGQDSLAHYSAVSRTLAACDPETVTAVRAVLDAVSRPFIQQAVDDVLLHDGYLTLDLDLMGRAVSNTSQSYPEAAFGWMGSGVGLGYQMAQVSMSTQRYGRQWLAGFHHPGDTVSVECLKELTLAAEEQLKIRPRRRPELLEPQLTALAQRIAQVETWAQKQAKRAERARERHALLGAKLKATVRTLADLEAKYAAQQRPVKPTSQLAQLRKQRQGWERRRARALEQAQQAEARAERHRQKAQALREAHQALTQRMAQYQAENAANPHPVVIFVRIDAGFASGPNLAWLIEMGYIPYTKANNNKVAQALWTRVDPGTVWVRVGDNAEMTAWDGYFLNGCPYPLTVALERFQTPQGQKHAALLTYRDDGQMLTLPAWFTFYNGRQTIEAGNKEEKQVFKVQHLMSRSPAGIQLQELFTLFGANFVRWAAVWLRDQTPEGEAAFLQTLDSVKTMVRVAANSPAWLIRNPLGAFLEFAEPSRFAGIILRLSGSWCYQPALPLLRPLHFSST